MLHGGGTHWLKAGFDLERRHRPVEKRDTVSGARTGIAGGTFAAPRKIFADDAVTNVSGVDGIGSGRAEIRMEAKIQPHLRKRIRKVGDSTIEWCGIRKPGVDYILCHGKRTGTAP